MTKISIIGGCGHVGLPLGITLAKFRHETYLVDSDKDKVLLVASGKMPFMEENGEAALGLAIKSGYLKTTTEVSTIVNSDIVIVTIGTPVDEFQSPIPRVFQNFFEEIKPYLRKDQLLILRSTVYPGTSEWLAKRLEPLGVGLAYCPERILQGFALEELLTLPQIVSGSSKKAIRAAADLFQSFSPTTVEANFLEAELSKLFLNSYRYIQFAVANEFYRICNESGIDFENLRSIMSSDYPRGKGIPKAGLSAGPCLLKDTQQLLAFSSNNFHIGYQAILSNEGLAIYIVDKIVQKYDLENSTVGILGMAFKADNDDIRSSLSYKIRKILQFKAKKVLSADKFVSVDKTLISEELLIEQCSIVIIGAPHGHYADLQFKDKTIIDIWGITGGGVLI